MNRSRSVMIGFFIGGIVTLSVSSIRIIAIDVNTYGTEYPIPYNS